jgi:hypothetical protein
MQTKTARSGRPQHRTARTVLPEQDNQNRTAKTGYLEQGKEHRTDRRGLPTQDCQDSTSRTGQSDLDSQDRTAGKVQLGRGTARKGKQDNQNGTGGRRNAEEDCLDRQKMACRARLPGEDRQTGQDRFCRHRNASTGLPGQDYQERMPGLVSLGIEPGYIIFPSHKNNV